MDSEKKEKLLRAATELFARNGYDGVSIREISEAAGVNSAMISYYFGGKRGLYSAAAGTRKRPAPFTSKILTCCNTFTGNSSPLPAARPCPLPKRSSLSTASSSAPRKREWPKGSSARNWTRRPWSSSSREP